MRIKGVEILKPLAQAHHVTGDGARIVSTYYASLLAPPFICDH